MYNASNSAWQHIQQIANHLIQDAHEIQTTIQQLQFQTAQQPHFQNQSGFGMNQMRTQTFTPSSISTGQSSALNAVMNGSQQSMTPGAQPQQGAYNSSALQQVMSQPSQYGGSSQSQYRSYNS